VKAGKERLVGKDDYPFDEAIARSTVLALMNDADLGGLWVAWSNAARSNGVAVGYLAVTFGFSLMYRGRDAFVDEIYIAEGHRGQGLGSEALDLAETFCRAHGVQAMHLEVERHRRRAQQLYESRGYVDQHRRLMSRLLHDDTAP
jgi:GNAT superfamily N-acetyltransferase